MGEYVRIRWHKLSSDSTIKYLGTVIIILGLFLGFLPYTQGRGWGYPEMITNCLQKLSFGHIRVNPSVLYDFEAKVLAHTADVLFLLLLVFIGLIIYRVFFKREPKGKGENSELDARYVKSLIRHYQSLINRNKRLLSKMEDVNDRNSTSNKV